MKDELTGMDGMGRMISGLVWRCGDLFWFRESWLVVGDSWLVGRGAED